MASLTFFAYFNIQIAAGTEISVFHASHPRCGNLAESNADRIGALSTGRTKGKKSLLYIRVNFRDALEEPISLTNAQNDVRGANEFFVANSYGQFSVSGFDTPLLTMPDFKSNYFQLKDGSIWWYKETVIQDARNVAREVGYDTSEFDFDCVRFNPGFNSSYGTLSGKGAWITHSGADILAHELGHNLGLMHANQWNPTGTNPLGDGAHEEYGNPYDIMGRAYDTVRGHFCAYNKHLLGWLPQGSIAESGSSFATRLYPIDRPLPEVPVTLAIRTKNSKGSEYWVETRSLYQGNPSSLTNHLLVYWSPWKESNKGTHLLKVGSAAPALTIGTSLQDGTAGVAFAPFRKTSDVETAVAVLFGRPRANSITSLGRSGNNLILFYSGDPFHNCSLWRSQNVTSPPILQASQRTDSSGFAVFESSIARFTRGFYSILSD